MNLKGIDIGFFHDLLGDGVQPTSTQRAGVEPFDVRSSEYKMTSLKDPIRDDLDYAQLEHELDPNRISFVVDKLNVHGSSQFVGSVVTRPTSTPTLHQNPRSIRGERREWTSDFPAARC